MENIEKIKQLLLNSRKSEDLFDGNGELKYKLITTLDCGDCLFCFEYYDGPLVCFRCGGQNCSISESLRYV